MSAHDDGADRRMIDADTQAAVAELIERAERLPPAGFNELERRLEKLREHKRREAEEQAEEQVRAIARQFGLDPQEVGRRLLEGGAGKETKPQAPPKRSERGGTEAGQERGNTLVKYRHPHDMRKTWKGFGRRPKWLRELEDQGYDREQFRVDDGDA